MDNGNTVRTAKPLPIEIVLLRQKRVVYIRYIIVILIT
jgi:hypothetical protein